jgi:hypothetical protein
MIINAQILGQDLAEWLENNEPEWLSQLTEADRQRELALLLNRLRSGRDLPASSTRLRAARNLNPATGLRAARKLPSLVPFSAARLRATKDLPSLTLFSATRQRRAERELPALNPANSTRLRAGRNPPALKPAISTRLHADHDLPSLTPLSPPRLPAALDLPTLSPASSTRLRADRDLSSLSGDKSTLSAAQQLEDVCHRQTPGIVLNYFSCFVFSFCFVDISRRYLLTQYRKHLSSLFNFERLRRFLLPLQET